MSTLTAVSNVRAANDGADSMKGLHNFIMRLRLCNGGDDEDKIVNEELAKIRGCFKQPAVDGYTKKKCICKLLYVFLLGKQVSFGMSEALSLLSSNVISEKQIGYLYISILFNSKNSIPLLIQCIKSDLLSNNHKFSYLAIQCVANIANKEMAAELSPTIFNLVKAKTTPDYVLQSALLCMLRLVRVAESVHIDWSEEVLNMMGGNMGVVLNALSLLDGLLKADTDLAQKTANVVRIVVSEMRRILSEIRPGMQEYQYGNVPAPWHLVSFMRILRNFGVPKDDYSKHMLEEVLNGILDKIQEPVDSGRIRKDLKCINVKYAVFFETVGVIVQNTESVKLWSRAQVFAGWLLGHKITNFRYLALEALGQLAGATFLVKPLDDIQKTAVAYLEKESDPSIQQRAVDFLCSISNPENVSIIVEDLLEFLKNPECSNRKSVAEQIAGIAEKFPSHTWYVGTLIKLMAAAGDVLDNKISSKIVNVVEEREEVQTFAANASFAALVEPYPHENLLVVSAFILGEFGHLISNSDATAVLQFQVLKSKYAHCSAETKAIVLSSFLKMAHRRSALRQHVCDLFQENATSGDLEIQTRSVEYLKLLETTNNGFLSAVLKALPPSECEQRFSSGDRPRNCTDGDAPTIFLQLPNDFVPFVTSNQGVVHDDAVLKITLDASYQSAAGRMTVTFESKFLSVPTFSTPKLSNPDSKLVVKANHKNQRKSKKVDMNFAFECNGVFEDFPKVYIDLTVDNSLRIKIILNLPIFVNKFFEPAPMTDRAFLEKWRILESQSIAIDRLFESPKRDDVSAVKTLLTGANLSLLVLSGPNPFKHVIGCCGVYESSESAIGVLVRLEIDASVRSFRMSVRSPDAVLAAQVAELLQSIL